MEGFPIQYLAGKSQLTEFGNDTSAKFFSVGNGFYGRNHIFDYRHDFFAVPLRDRLSRHH